MLERSIAAIAHPPRFPLHHPKIAVPRRLHSSSPVYGPSTLDAATLRLFSQRAVRCFETSPKIKWKFKSENPAQAAVLVPLCLVKGVPSVLFTVRASKLRKHAGQVSFPGGRMDDTDISLIHTALRETEEETGLNLFRVLGPLPHLPDRTATIEVHPFLAYIVSPDTPKDLRSRYSIANCKTYDTDGFRPNELEGYPGVAELDVDSIKFNPDEVSSVFTLPLSELLDPEKTTLMQFRSIEGLQVPSWKGPEGISIWGAEAKNVQRKLLSLNAKKPHGRDTQYCAEVAASEGDGYFFRLILSFLTHASSTLMSSNPSKKTKTVFITGASSGIGYHTAHAYARKYSEPRSGPHAALTLVLTARRLKNLQQAKEDIERSYPGIRVEVFALDVTDSHQVFDVFRKAVEVVGRIDVVIANSGVAIGGEVGGWDAFVDQEKQIQTNLLGAMATVNAAVEHMKEVGGGHIVGIGSVAAYKGFPWAAAYCASKAALNSYFTAISVELAKHHISVGIIHPGFIDTDIIQDVTFRPFSITAERGGEIVMAHVERGTTLAIIPFFPWALPGRLMAFTPAWIIGAILGKEAAALGAHKKD
ncbi:hypothetical protein HDU96_009013 [Phlyctochytrium bullatum]|nr:hypothetical protein HDU96_009013 [Phlyctochytrium bullatum]